MSDKATQADKLRELGWILTEPDRWEPGLEFLQRMCEVFTFDTAEAITSLVVEDFYTLQDADLEERLNRDSAARREAEDQRQRDWNDPWRCYQCKTKQTQRNQPTFTCEHCGVVQVSPAYVELPG